MQGKQGINTYAGAMQDAAVWPACHAAQAHQQANAPSTSQLPQRTTAKPSHTQHPLCARWLPCRRVPGSESTCTDTVPLSDSDAAAVLALPLLRIHFWPWLLLWPRPALLLLADGLRRCKHSSMRATLQVTSQTCGSTSHNEQSHLSARVALPPLHAMLQRVMTSEDGGHTHFKQSVAGIWVCGRQRPEVRVRCHALNKLVMSTHGIAACSHHRRTRQRCHTHLSRRTPILSTRTSAITSSSVSPTPNPTPRPMAFTCDWLWATGGGGLLGGAHESASYMPPSSGSMKQGPNGCSGSSDKLVADTPQPT